MRDVKSLTVVELGEWGSAPVIRAVPLKPLHDMAELRGTFEELTSPDYYTENPHKEHYLRIILTNENDVPDAIARLRMIYPNVMHLEYDNTRTKMNSGLSDLEASEQLGIFELFTLFYREQNGKEMSDEQYEYMQKLIEKVEENHI